MVFQEYYFAFKLLDGGYLSLYVLFYVIIFLVFVILSSRLFSDSQKC